MVSQGDLCHPPCEGPAQSNAPLVLSLMRNARLRMASSGGMERDGIGLRGRQLHASTPILSPALMRDVEICLASSCSPFLRSKECWARMGTFGFIFSKCFLPGTLLRVPSWPPVCTTLQGEVAKKSELLECSGPRNIALRGSLVLARMSL